MVEVRMLANPLAVLSYVLISTFTPGPSNITSASMGVLHGYRNTLKLQMGLAAGVLIIMLLSGLISTTLLSVFPILEPVLRFAGAGYILYLAWSLLRASYIFADEAVPPLGFVHGLTLNVLNPKLIVYAFTLFSGFLAEMTSNLPLVVVAAIVLAAISLCATSVWALFGTGIKTYLQNPRLKTIVNILLSLSLVYAAIALLGIV
jgi:cysteine/O-acetylserine efflux protein